MSTEGSFQDWKLSGTEKVVRNGRFVKVNRLEWLPDAQRQVGYGYHEKGELGIIYFLRSGNFELITTDISSFLTVPPERVFETIQEEFFFCLFNRRCWYFLLKGGVFYAKYSK